MSYRPLAASYNFSKKSQTHGVVGDRRFVSAGRTRLRVGQILFASPTSLHSGFDQAADKFGNVGSALLEVSIKWVSLREFMHAAAVPASCPACPKTRTTTTRAPPTCAADADLLAEIERLRERATTYGLVAAVALALCIITVIVGCTR